MIKAAAILAGGPGQRMWPFATVRNKCAMPVAGMPNVRRLCNDLTEIGVQRIFVVVGANSGSIRHALLGLDPEPIVVRQAEGAGTAGAALAALHALGDEPTLALPGDLVTPAEVLQDFVHRWQASGAEGALLSDAMPPGEGGDWYAVSGAGGLRPTITGHEFGAERRWCEAAIVSPSLKPALEANPGRLMQVPVGGMPPMEPDLAQSLNDWNVDKVVIEAADFVVHMDKPWHVIEANRRMSFYLTGRLEADRIHPTARIDDGAEIDGHVSLGPNSMIGKRAVISGNIIVGAETRITNGPIVYGGNVIGDRTQVRDYCLVDRGAVIGSDCIVGHGAEIDGVMFDRSYLWHYCEISGLVGQSVDIGAATVCGTLRFDDQNAEHRVRGRRETPRIEANATYYGDHSRTGVNVITMPGAKIGAYSCVGAGIVVYEDVPDRTLMLLKQETVQRPWGPERYGW